MKIKNILKTSVLALAIITSTLLFDSNVRADYQSDSYDGIFDGCYDGFYYNVRNEKTEGKVYRLEVYYGKAKEVTIPDIKDADKIEVSIGNLTVGGYEDLKKIIIPADDRIELAMGSYRDETVEELEVEEGNSRYISKNNVIYTKDMKQILVVGKARKKLVIPSTVRKVKWPLLNTNLEEIRIGKNVSELAGNDKSDDDKGDLPIESYYPANDCVLLPKSLKKITVAKENKKFCVKNNVLYDKKMKKIYGCGAIKGKYVMPSTVEKVCQGAFQNRELTSVVINNRVKVLPIYMFSNCKNLKNVKIGKNVKDIWYGVFENTGIKSLDIPKNVKRLEMELHSFKMPKLKKITVYKNLKISYDDEWENVNSNNVRKYYKRYGVTVSVKK